MEVVHAVLALGREPSRVVGARAQPLLHRLAHLDVLALDLVAERDRLAQPLELLRRKIGVHEPLEDGERAIEPEREDGVELQVVGVEVEHQVGEDPVVERALLVVAAQVAAVAPEHAAGRVARAQRRVLRRVEAARHHLVAVVVDRAVEARMRDRDVVALEIVVDVDLPVGGQRVVAALERHQLGEAEAGRLDLGRDLAQELGERRRAGVEVHERHRRELFDARLAQPHLLRPEALDALHLARLEQAAVEAVGPTVVAALERGRVAAAFDDPAGAMRADVPERAQRAVATADHEQRIARHLAGHEVAGVGEARRGARPLPGAREDRVLLGGEHRRIDVPAGGQRRGARDVGSGSVVAQVESHRRSSLAHVRARIYPRLEAAPL